MIPTLSQKSLNSLISLISLIYPYLIPTPSTPEHPNTTNTPCVFVRLFVVFAVGLALYYAHDVVVVLAQCALLDEAVNLHAGVVLRNAE